MHRSSFIHLALIVLWQATMIIGIMVFDESVHWLAGLFALAALLVTFVAYIVAGYQVAAVKRFHRVMKAALVTVASFVLTLAGYIGFFYAGVQLRAGGSQVAQGRALDRCVCHVTNDWSRFTAEHDGFSVLMPFRPTISVLTNATAAGPILMTQFRAEASRAVAFSVVHNQFPSNIKFVDSEEPLEASLKGALGTDGRLISKKSIQLDGHAGREWQFEKLHGQALITMRVFSVDHELYQVVCVMPAKQPCPEHIKEFLNSFKLEVKPTPTPPDAGGV